MSLEQKVFTIFQQDRLKQLKLHRLSMQKPTLHQTLFVLAFGSRINNHPAPNSNRRDISFSIDNHCAYRDVEDAVTSGSQKSDRSRVSTAWKAFELTDNLHRANLRCAGHRSTRKQGSHQLNQARPLSQRRLDRRRHLP